MPEIAVSLIIPVYNSQPYLEKCVNSAINQTLKDMELIIVDDGSTDNSLPIINEFAAADCRIKVLHQENKGPGAARNLGIKEASGRYVAFMDSDDWIDPTYLEKATAAAVKKGADIVICGHRKVTGGAFEFPSMNRRLPYCPDYGHAMKQVIKDSGIRGYVWDKLYRRSLFTENSVTYPEGLYYEDLATTFKLFYHSKRTVILKEKLYNYLQRPNSLSKKMDPRQIHDRVTALEMMRSFLEKEGIFEDYGYEFRYLCTKMWFAEVFCLAVIYLVTGEKGFRSSLLEITRRTRRLLSSKRTGTADDDEVANKSFTRV